MHVVKKILLSLILFFFGLFASGQNLEHIYARAKQYVDLAQFDSAESCIKDCYQKSLKSNNHYLSIKSKLKLAELYIETANYSSAIKLIHETDGDLIRKFADLAFISDILYASVAIAKSQIDTAHIYLNKAYNNKSKIEDNELMGDLYFQRGQLDYLLSNFERTKQSIDSAQLFYSSTNKIRFARCYTLRQKLAYRLRDRENQTIALHHIEAILDEMKIKEHPLWGFVYYGYGYLYFDKGVSLQFDARCNEYFWKYYNEVKKFYADNHPQTAIAYNYLGISYEQMKEYDKAKFYYEKSLKIWQTIFGKDDYNASFCYTNLGNIATSPDSSRYFFQKAINIRETVFKSKKHPLLANAYIKMSNSYRKSALFYQALSNAQKAICSVAPNFNDTVNLLNNPNVGNFYDHELYKALRNKMTHIIDAYYDLDSSLIYYPVAINCIQKMDSILINGSQSLQIVDQMLLADRNNSYSGIFLMSYKLYSMTKDKKYINVAIDFADKLQASLLFSDTYDSDADFKLLKKIKQELFALDKKEIAEGIISSQSLHFKLSLQDSIQQLELKLSKIRSPLFTKSIDITELQTQLKKDEAIIAYPTFYDHLSNFRAFAILLISKDTAWINFDQKNFGTKLQEYVNVLESGSLNEQTISISNEIYSIFFPENIDKLLTQKKIKQLHIIPGHELLQLPFETLLTEKVYKRKQNLGRYPFLIKKYTVSYSPSINFFYRSALKQSDRKYANELLMVAPVFDNASCSTLAGQTRSLVDQNGWLDPYKLYRDGKIQPLPFSEHEATEVNTIFKQKGYATDLMMRETASKNAFLEKVKGSRIVHLATHSFANISKPEFSGVIFSAAGNNQSNILFNGEIKGLDIRADLLVLSACQTACGQPLAGEGIDNLSRSFATAKVSNVIASLWKVSDESTSLLMIDFYKHLLNNNYKSYAESLRYAKLKMMNSKKFSNPFYWAAFTLTCY